MSIILSIFEISNKKVRKIAILAKKSEFAEAATRIYKTVLRLFFCFIKENGTVKLREGSIPTLFHAPKHQSKCIYVSKTHEGSRKCHKFLLQNPAHLQKWLSNIALQNFYPTKDNILCSDHFKPNCFRWVKNKFRLKMLAVPTIFKPTLLREMNASSSQMEATAATNIEKLRNATEMEAVDLEAVESVKSGCNQEMVTTAEIETATDSKRATNVGIDAEIETTIDVNCMRDMTPPLIPSTPTSSRQKKKLISISTKWLRHDHHYETSPRTLKIQLALA